MTAGQQDTRHLRIEPLRPGPLRETARPLVKRSHQPARAADVPGALERAFRVALIPPTGPVFLSLPMDFIEGEAKPITPHTPTPPGPPPEAAPRSVAGALSSARRPALVTGAALEMAGGWAAGIDLAEKLALEVHAAPRPARPGFPTAHPNFRYLPYGAPALYETLEQHDVILVVGASVFVMYPYVESQYLPPNVRLILLTDDPDEAACLEWGEAHLRDLRVALKALLYVREPTERRVNLSRDRPQRITKNLA